MNTDRWNYLKALSPPAPRYLHVSCDAAMIPNPLIPGMKMPWVERPGKTYNVGRNKAKRAVS